MSLLGPACVLCLDPLEEEEEPPKTPSLQILQLCEFVQRRRVKSHALVKSTPPQNIACAVCSPCSNLIQTGVEIQAQIARLESELEEKVELIRSKLLKSSQNPPHGLDTVEWEEVRHSLLRLTGDDTESESDLDLAQKNHVQVKVKVEDVEVEGDDKVCSPPPPDSPSPWSFFIFPGQGGEEDEAKESFKQENPSAWAPDFEDHDPLDLEDSPPPPPQTKKKRKICPSQSQDSIPNQENGGGGNPSLNPRVVITPIKLTPSKGAVQTQQSKKVGPRTPQKSIRRRHPCPLCGKKFRSVGPHLFMAHETEEKAFPCPQPQCGKGFTLQVNLDRHVHLHRLEKRRPFVCGVCDSRWSTQAVLDQHSKTHKVFSCPHCPLEFKDAQPLQRHLKTHSTYPCDLCEESFTLLVDRPVHTAKAHAHPGPQEVFECPVCGKAQSSARSLKLHLARHEGRTAVRCGEGGCGEQFKDRATLKTHMIQRHGQEPFVCEGCGATLMSLKSVRDHALAHAGLKPRPHKCEVCGMGFGDRGRLAAHTRTHTGERPYVCEHCGVGFKMKSTLRAHVKSIHEGQAKELRHPCPHCPFKFPEKYILEGHIRQVHTGERPFVCSVCSKGYAVKTQLTQHQKSHGITPTTSAGPDRLPRSVRDGPGPAREGRPTKGPAKRSTPLLHPCPRCGKEFDRKFNLDRHLAQKTGMRCARAKKQSRTPPPPPSPPDSSESPEVGSGT